MSEEVPCHRIKREVIAALARVTSVRRVASFGSIAEGRSDRWSDVDLLVACEDLAVSQWIAAAAIRAAKPVCFYRMFTAVAQPSGRYWFADESPFNRIDVSFYCVADYLALCSGGGGGGLKNGHAIKTHEEYSATVAPDLMRDRTVYGLTTAAAIQPHETEAGCCLYFHLEAVKNHMRGQQGKRDAQETRASLARMIEQSRGATFGGGDFLSLASRSVELVDCPTRAFPKSDGQDDLFPESPLGRRT